METLITTRLHAVLIASLEGKQAGPDADAYTLWREFADAIAAFAPDSSSISSLLRGLYHARAEYSTLLEQARSASKDFCCDLASRAVKTLDSEIELLHLAVKYPHILQQPRGTVPTLFLADGFNQSHVVELIKGYHAVRFLKRGDGAPATMADITALFEWALNLKIPNVDQKAYNAVNRMKGPAQFLVRMVEALEELSRR